MKTLVFGLLLLGTASILSFVACKQRPSGAAVALAARSEVDVAGALERLVQAEAMIREARELLAGGSSSSDENGVWCRDTAAVRGPWARMDVHSSACSDPPEICYRGDIDEAVRALSGADFGDFYTIRNPRKRGDKIYMGLHNFEDDDVIRAVASRCTH